MDKKEKHRKLCRDYYYKNRDGLIKKAKEYYKNNKERVRLVKKKSYEKHKEKYKLRNRLWQATPEAIYYFLQQSSKTRSMPIEISKEDFISWYGLQDKRCYFCGITEEQIKKSNMDIFKKYKRLTIDRLDNYLGYSTKNIKLACFICNRIKGNFFTESEMLKVGKIISNKYKK